MLARGSRVCSAFLSLTWMLAPAVFAAPAPGGPLLVVQLGEGPVALTRPWQFQLGDDPGWASPNVDDSGWRPISARQTWARQGYFKYTGYAWYRLHVQFQPEQLRASNVHLLIPRIDDAYELYWNGVLVGRNGKLPPHPWWPEFSQPPQIFRLGPAHEGVLAIRVWKAPLLSEDSGLRGGFEAPPLAGTPPVIAMQKALLDYTWLRSRQLYFGLNTLYGIIGLLTLVAWMRNRHQWQLFWMSGFALSRIIYMIFWDLRLPWSLGVAGALWQPWSAFRAVSFSFLLLWLLQLREDRAIVRLTRACAWICIATNSLDGLVCFFIWRPGWTTWVQAGDGLLAAIYVAVSILPLLLVAVAVSRRERLNKTRWLVAICAFFAGMLEVLRFVIPQGSRFTHWTIADQIAAPLFSWNGNVVSLMTISSTLLLFVSAFAVYRSFEENRRRQAILNQEFESARALQQVLIPQELPSVPGLRIASAYHPALEVGGDFFQVIPVPNAEGDTLIMIGDVSGKGLKAAMAVSFIVGTVHALVEHTSSPGTLLSELNRRLRGRLENGLTTCLALRLGADGRCVIAGAGHPPPFIDGREIQIDNGFPLGVFAEATYEETEFVLERAQTCMLYTDGLTEARNKNGELFGEERLAKLFAACPSARQAAETAIQFGQDDDVTVLSITRLQETMTPQPSGAAVPVRENPATAEVG